MDKSPEAFRTISEVAETLETPAHVLRFWESRFPQIRPVKRAGGRRYYRPADVALLTGIKRLLHEEGLTIRGVQKILREQGVRHVARLAGAPEGDLAPFDPEVALEEAMAERFASDRTSADPVDDPAPVAEVETAQIFALETALRRPVAEDAPATPDLFDLLADEAGTEDAVSIFADDAEPSVEPTPAPPNTMPAAQPEDVSAELDPPGPLQGDAEEPLLARSALLRALPRPLPDDLRAMLLPLHQRIAAHRDRLVEAARSTGHRG